MAGVTTCITCNRVTCACHTRLELAEILVRYGKAGIENREYKAQRAILADVDAGKMTKDELFARAEELMKERLGKPGAAHAAPSAAKPAAPAAPVVPAKRPSAPYSMATIAANRAGSTCMRTAGCSAPVMRASATPATCEMRCAITVSAASNTVLQTVVEASKRGRVMALFGMAYAGLAPIGSLLGGFVADPCPKRPPGIDLTCFRADPLNRLDRTEPFLRFIRDSGEVHMVLNNDLMAWMYQPFDDTLKAVLYAAYLGGNMDAQLAHADPLSSGDDVAGMAKFIGVELKRWAAVAEAAKLDTAIG